MPDGSDDTKAAPTAQAAQTEDAAHQDARQQFAARRAYKRALRRARNPLYLSLRSLILLALLVVLSSAMTLLLIFALRRQPATAPATPIIKVVAASPAAAIAEEAPAPAATAIAEVQVILAAETPANMSLEGPAIPTVIITGTPVPLRVGVAAAVFGVGNDKLNIRNRPGISGSQVLFREDDGKQFDIIGGPQEADGFTWWQVRDPQFQVEGWAVANYLRAITPDTGQSR